LLQHQGCGDHDDGRGRKTAQPAQPPTPRITAQLSPGGIEHDLVEQTGRFFRRLAQPTGAYRAEVLLERRFFRVGSVRVHRHHSFRQ
jgi:hypothetical protein